MHYDRNSHPRFIGDGMSKLTGSVAEGCKRPAFQTRGRIGIEVAPNDFEAGMARVNGVRDRGGKLPEAKASREMLESMWRSFIVVPV
jgi:hypothetical protein